MRIRILGGALVALALATSSCSENGSVAPVAPGADRLNVAPLAVLPEIRISEIHYDNTGGDVGESIEISGPAGTDLTGWSIVLYNGSPASRSSYGTTNLTQTIAASCGSRGVVTITYPVNGIQNGGSGSTEPDGIALVNASAQVVEFLSYEGSFVAANGPATGLTSTNIGVFEAGNEAVGLSLQRAGDDTWSGPSPSSFGTCNDDVVTPPPTVASVTVSPATATVLQGGTQQFTGSAFDASSQPIPSATLTWTVSDPTLASVSTTGLVTAVQPGDVTVTATAANGVFGTASLHIDANTGTLADIKFSEIHYDNNGTDQGEAIEVMGPAGSNLAGWSIVLYNGNGGAPYGTIPLSGVLTDQCSGRGVATFNGPASGIQNGNPDGFALIGPAGQVVEFLSYGGVFTANGGPASGMASVDIGRSESASTPVGESLQRKADLTWIGPFTNSFGACNPDVPPPPPQFITFSGRTASDPALPVGFEDQIFATLVIGGVNTPTTFTWVSETPDIASVDADGVVRALAAGSATIRATASDGTTRTTTLATVVATPSSTAQYGHNSEFGEPTDGNPADDLVIRRAQYTSSFNAPRGIPNWVSYNIDATHFGSQDRCDCFTYDPELPAAGRYTTADYTGAGAFHGYGIDRGHLARSFDRTSANFDNATTFYFSNIIPQAADNNQGPWAALESHLGNLAISQNKEVFVIAGASGSKGTVKNEGQITIPAVTWKVAVIMGRDQGLPNVDDVSDIEVIAVVMPNDPGIRNTAWESFKTTVDVVEQVSGYNLLALLRDDIELAVESGSRPPTAVINGPFTIAEGGSIAASGSSSSDPDAGQALTYSWTFGDGGSASGVSASHTYTQDGTFTVRLIVSDPFGLADTAMTTATVTNVAPNIGALPGSTLLPGEPYVAKGSFTDPGADSWTATVDYGDGDGARPLALFGKNFLLGHVYRTAGTYTVTVRVTDDDVTSERTATVTVLTPLQGLEEAVERIDALVASETLTEDQAKFLYNKIENAIKHLERGQKNPTLNQLEDVVRRLTSLVQQRVLTVAEAAPVFEIVVRVMRSIS